MNEETTTYQPPKNGSTRTLKDKGREIFLDGRWHLESDIKNFSLQKKLRNYK